MNQHKENVCKLTYSNSAELRSLTHICATSWNVFKTCLKRVWNVSIACLECVYLEKHRCVVDVCVVCVVCSGVLCSDVVGVVCSSV